MAMASSSEDHDQISVRAQPSNVHVDHVCCIASTRLRRPRLLRHSTALRPRLQIWSMAGIASSSGVTSNSFGVTASSVSSSRLQRIYMMVGLVILRLRRCGKEVGGSSSSRPMWLWKQI